MDVQAVSPTKAGEMDRDSGRCCLGDRCKRQAPCLLIGCTWGGPCLWPPLDTAVAQPFLDFLTRKVCGLCNFSPGGRLGAPLPSLITAGQVQSSAPGKPLHASRLDTLSSLSSLRSRPETLLPSARHFADVAPFTQFLRPVSRTIHSALCHKLPLLPLHVPPCNFSLSPSHSVSTSGQDVVILVITGSIASTQGLGRSRCAVSSSSMAGWVNGWIGE